MANIRISDLRPAGSDFFLDDEGFMNDLSDELTGEIMGGLVISPTRPTLPTLPTLPTRTLPTLPTRTIPTLPTRPTLPPITVPVINL